MRRFLLTLTVALGLVVAMSGPGEAQGASCSVSATGVAFGNYDVLNGSPLDSTGSITYQCSFLGIVRVDLSQGSSGNYNQRQMRRGVEVLNYNLFTDTARTTIWGNGSGSTSRITAIVFPGFPRTSTVYGRVLPLQNAVVGLYSDSIVVTVSF